MYSAYSRGLTAFNINKQYQKSELINLILASNAKLFIGGHSQDPSNKGDYISPLVKGYTPTEFLTLLQETFGSDAVTQADLNEFKLDIEKMLTHFTGHIIDMMKQQNNELFNRFVSYDKDGAFRSFAVFYPKMVSGRFKEIEPSLVISRLCNLYPHFLKELGKVPEYRTNGEIDVIYPPGEGPTHPVLITKENFMVLLDILIMHTACEYYGDKDNFSSDTVIQDSINLIRDTLLFLFNAIPHRRGPEQKSSKSNDKITRKNLSHVYLLNNWRSNPERFEEIKLLMQHNYSTGEMSDFFNSILDNGNYNDLMRYEEHFYFDILVELMGYLNCFEQMYQKLKEHAYLDQSAIEKGESAKFTLMLNERNLNVLPVQKSDTLED